MTDSDIAALADLVARYAIAADDRDEAELTELFTADAELVRPAALLRDGDQEVVSGGEVIARTIVDSVSRLHSTFHQVGQQVVDIDGDTATGVTYCVAHHIYRKGEEYRDNSMGVKYIDTFRRDSSGWRIARRAPIVEYSEDRTVRIF